MQYLVTTLPEMLCTYLGLAVQMELRRLFLSPVLGVIVALNFYRLVVEHQDSKAPLRPWLLYVLSCLGLAVIFWPDATIFGRGTLPQLTAAQVGSYTALEDPNADIRTAEDARHLSIGPADRVVGAVRQTPVVFETPGMRLMLQIATETSLALGRRISSTVHRPFAPIVATEWFVGMALTADTTRALQDWLEGCYKPSLLTDAEFTEAITAKDLSPWGEGPVARALASREAVPGAQTGKGYFRSTTPLGLAFWSNPGSSPAVKCDVYLAAVQADVEHWLFTATSPAGTPLSQVFEEALGLSVELQARQIIHREMLRLLQAPVPAPSLTGSYALLSGANAALGVAAGAASSRSWHGGLLGGGSAITSQAQQATQRLLWWVGMAAWLLLWMPYILGTMQLVVVGLAPVAFCWMFVPGQQLRALLTYFLTLCWVYSSPIWFALIDLLARMAASQAPQTPDAILQILNWAPAQLYSVIATVVGLALIPVLMAGMLYGSLRVQNALLRAFA